MTMSPPSATNMAPAALEPVVELRGVGKRYGTHVALRDATLNVWPGEIVGLVGANGAGKSTLLRVVATLARPSRGSVRMFGIDPTRQQRDVRARIGVVSHTPYVYPELSCRENLRFLATMRGLTGDGVGGVEALLTATLARVGLHERMEQRAGSLSRGLLQRLALATALLHQPALLLLDEPDTGLDVGGRDVLSGCIAEWAQRQGSVVFTSHDLGWVQATATRIIAIEAGRIVVDCAAEAISADQVAAVVRAGEQTSARAGTGGRV